jgi:hypothetical protein
VISGNPTSPTSPTIAIRLRHRSSLRSSAEESIFDAYGDVTTPTTISTCKPHCDSLVSPQSPTKEPLYAFSRLLSTSSAEEPKQSVGNQPALVGLPKGHVEILQNHTNILEGPIQPLEQEQGKLPQQPRFAEEGYLTAALCTDQNAVEFGKIQGKLDMIVEMLQQPQNGLDFTNTSNLAQNLQGVRNLLETQLQEVLKRLDDGPNFPPVDVSSFNPGKHSQSMSDDLSVVHAKLDELLAFSCQKGKEKISQSRQSMDAVLAVEVSFCLPGCFRLIINMTQLKEILTALKSEQHQLAIQGQQQADSVRYLNELNSVSQPLILFPNDFE